MAGLARLAEDRIAARLAATLPKWRYAEGRLRRTWRTPDWKSAMALADAIGWLAESAWHHPDLAISFGRVSIDLTTHDAGGVTERDVALAERIEALVAWRPDPAGPFEAPPRPSLLPEDS